LRRLKLAVTSTSGVAIVFRPLRESSQPSPASIRVALRPERDLLRVDVIKNEGRKPASALLDVRSQWAHTS
jgi:protein ImuA